MLRFFRISSFSESGLAVLVCVCVWVVCDSIFVDIPEVIFKFGRSFLDPKFRLAFLRLRFHVNSTGCRYDLDDYTVFYIVLCTMFTWFQQDSNPSLWPLLFCLHDINLGAKENCKSSWFLNISRTCGYNSTSEYQCLNLDLRPLWLYIVFFLRSIRVS